MSLYERFMIRSVYIERLEYFLRRLADKLAIWNRP